MDNPNLSESLKKLEEITQWFNGQEEVLSSPYFTKPIISESKRVFCKKIRSLVFNTGV